MTLDSVPMFVRGDGFIFRQPVVQHCGAMPGNPLRVLVAPVAPKRSGSGPANRSESSFYEDDGVSLEYRNGVFLRRGFNQIRDAQSLTIEISEPEGSYRPAGRDLILGIWADDKPGTAVEQRGEGAPAETLPRLDAAELASVPRGWSFANGMVTIKEHDRFEPVRFMIGN